MASEDDKEGKSGQWRASREMGGQIGCVCERASPYSAFAPGGIDRLTQDSDVLMFIKI